MKTSLHLPAGSYSALIEHLLPTNGKYEEAAFLFTTVRRAPSGETEFHLIEPLLLQPGDFAARYSDYLELKDSVRAGIIKRAHDLQASLVEIHSHVGPYGAAFSYSDISGLKEHVPHMWWRLKRRPYASIVVARDGIDALAWVNNPNTPGALDEIHDGGRILRPEGTTWRDWE
ncbi:MAG: hypothetical protein QM760_16080 [Nibricoccus sp.]